MLAFQFDTDQIGDFGLADNRISLVQKKPPWDARLTPLLAG
jgi:hypothetical protein